MKPMNKVVCLGELLIDFVPEANGLPLADVPSFKKAAGGAPANVAAAVAKLGGSSRFIGKVGADAFGDFLRGSLEEAGVEPALVADKDTRTGLAFVSLRADGERDFLFYRSPAADMLLSPDDVQAEWLEDAAVFHYGSVSLIAEPCRSATIDAAQRARKLGAIVTYDPNVRLALWPSAEEARKEITAQLKLAHLVKISEDELDFLFGTSQDLAAGAGRVLDEGPEAVLVTLGAKGAVVYTRTATYATNAPSVTPIDTTGAGDGFVGGLLYYLASTRTQPHELAARLADPSYAEAAVQFACCVGALATTKRGAIPAMPTLAEAHELLAAWKGGSR